LDTNKLTQPSDLPSAAADFMLAFCASASISACSFRPLWPQSAVCRKAAFGNDQQIRAGVGGKSYDMKLDKSFNVISKREGWL
jgi:hypothetical protein